MASPCSRKADKYSSPEEVALFLPSMLTSLFLPLLEVDAATGIICTARHCASYFPKDYCLWPLPLGQSWYHSRRPWLQRLTGRRGGNHHSPSNPLSLLWEWEDLLTGHQSAHCFSLSSISVSSLSHAPIKLHNKPHSATSASESQSEA